GLEFRRVLFRSTASRCFARFWSAKAISAKSLARTSRSAGIRIRSDTTGSFPRSTKVGDGLFRYPEAALGTRVHHVSLQAVLVGSPRRQPPAYLFPARLCRRNRSGKHGKGLVGVGASHVRRATDRYAGDDAPLRSGRPWRRPDAHHAG